MKTASGQRPTFRIITRACLFLFVATKARAAFRFPRPDFETDYVAPTAMHVSADPAWFAFMDVGLLALALALAATLALKQRRRAWTWALMAACLAYFGFYRQGCICPIGSIQNMALGLANPDYTVPITVVAIFALPLLFSLLFGRVFCSAVCPLGAIQDMFLLRPVHLPKWLTQTLSVIPILYLAIAVIFAAGGTGFLICRYDPFVAMFRLSGEAAMLAFGGALLALGLVVGRPYCRFLCPYGVLLNWTSRFAWRHATITPDECITCRLCEKACPFDSIQTPTGMSAVGPAKAGDRYGESVGHGARRVGAKLLLLPILIACGWFVGGQLAPVMARLDPVVQTAEQIWSEDVGANDTTTLRSESFRTTGKAREDLFAEARDTRARYRQGGHWLGVFAGLLISVKLLAFSLRRVRMSYEINRATCFSCARCFASCPREQVRRGATFIDEASLRAGATAPSDPAIEVEAPPL